MKRWAIVGAALLTLGCHEGLPTTPGEGERIFTFFSHGRKVVVVARGYETYPPCVLFTCGPALTPCGRYCYITGLTVR